MINANQIIFKVKKEAEEYLEMVENPDAFVSGILANKIIQLEEKIIYLERRLEANDREKYMSNR